MKIIHIVNFNTHHPWLFRLALQLKAISTEQFVCAIESRKVSDLYPDGIFCFTSVSKFKIIRIFDNLKYVRMLKLKSLDDPMLLICHGFLPSFFGYLAHKILKLDYIIFHHHQPKFLTHVLQTDSAKKFLLLKINSVSLRNALKIVAMSDEVIDYLREFSISDGDLICAPHGVNYETEAFKDQMRRHPNRVRNTILMIGRLSPEKQVHLALQTVALLSNRIPNLHLVIIGVGPNEGQLIRYAKELQVDQKVSFVGWQENVYDWLDKSHLFLHLAKTESYGQVLIEAFGSGIQIVSTQVGVFSELKELDSTGIRGLPEENLDSNIIAKTIEELLSTEHGTLRRWHLIQRHNEVRAHREFCLALQGLMRGANES